MPVQTLDQQIAALTHAAYDQLKTTVQKDELPGYIKKTASRLRVSGLGVTVGSVVERLYREIRPLRIYEGTTEIQKIIIATHVLRA